MIWLIIPTNVRKNFRACVFVEERGGGGSRYLFLWVFLPPPSLLLLHDDAAPLGLRLLRSSHLGARLLRQRHKLADLAVLRLAGVDGFLLRAGILGTQGVEVLAQARDRLVEERVQLVRLRLRKVLLLDHVVDREPLQARRQQHGSLRHRQAHAGLPARHLEHASVEVDGGQERDEVEDHRAVHHLPGEGRQALQVPRRHLAQQLRLRQLRHAAHRAAAVVERLDLRLHAGGVGNDAEGGDDADAAEGDGEKAEEALREVGAVLVDPRLRVVVAAVEGAEHDHRVLAGEVVLALAQVHRLELALLEPVVEQLGGQAVAHTEVVALLRPAVRQPVQEVRQLLPRTDREVADGTVLVAAAVLGVAALVVALLAHLPQRAHLAVVVLRQQAHGAAAVLLAREVRDDGDADDPHAAQLGEGGLLEVLAERVRDEVAAGTRPLAEVRLELVAGDAALGAHLDDGVDVGHAALRALRVEQGEQVVRRCVGQQLKVVGLVLVVGGDVQGNHALQKRLGRRVVREQRVPLHVEQLQLVRVHRRRRLRAGLGVQAQHLVQPRLDGVAAAVPDRLRQLHLLHDPPLAVPAARGDARLLLQVGEQLQGEGTARALVAGDGGREEEQVGAHQRLHERQGDGGRLVDDDKLRLRELRGVCGQDVLDGLAVLAEDVDADDGGAQLGGLGLHDLEVLALLVAHLLQTLHDKLEQGLHVVGGRRGDEDVGVTLRDGARGGQTQSSGLSASTSRGHSGGCGKALLRDGLHHRQHGRGLLQGDAGLHERAHDRVLLQLLLEQLQLALLVREDVLLHGLQRLASLRRERQHLELVVDAEEGGTVRKREQEALVEARHDGRVARVAVPLVHVHRERVELLQGAERADQQHDAAAALDRLHRPREQVGRQRLEVL
eukprot:Rhum_TRINITY_DN7579_c0_g1::Rhum_TRINITY_DN7579_c0_g1_i1::g.23620::m.23620